MRCRPRFADYLQDYGYDLEADWLRRGENMPMHTVAGTNWIKGQANVVHCQVPDHNGEPEWVAVIGCNGSYTAPYGRAIADEGTICAGGGLGTGAGNGSGYCSDPPMTDRMFEALWACGSYPFLGDWPA